MAWFDRRLLGGAILAAWVVVVGLHVQREYFKSDALRLAEGARVLAPGTYFYAVRMDGRTIGLATSRMDTTQSGFIFEDQLQIDVPALDTVHRALTETQVRLGPALELRDFTFNLDSEVGRFSVRGEARADSTVALEIETGGETERSALPLDDDFVLAATLPMRLAAAGKLSVGGEFRSRVFDPSVMARREVVTRVTAHDTLLVPDSAAFDAETEAWVPARNDTVPAWRIEQDIGGVSIASWVDDDGRVVSAESPLGFAVERTAYEVARDEWQRTQRDPELARGYGAVIEGTAISSNVDPAAVESVDRLSIRLLDVDLEGFDLEGGRQSLRGDTLVIERESLRGLDAGYRLPYDGGDLPEALEATPLIQSEDARIRRVAERIAGDADDPVEIARRLNDWVYDELSKDITLSVPSATQVLEARQGDCNEHTVLYVALARAMGLPARTAAGLVHIDGRFYYHAWPEVWLGRWVAMDPTLDQEPAGAAHLRFVVGGLARQVDLVRLIGRLRIEVL